MQASVGIDKLEVRCLIGCRESERVEEQSLWVDLRADYDISAPAASDAIGDAVSYVDLAQIFQQTARAGQFHLLEALAVTAAREVFARFPIERLWLKLRKPEVLPDVEATVLEATWSRGDLL